MVQLGLGVPASLGPHGLRSGSNDGLGLTAGPVVRIVIAVLIVTDTENHPSGTPLLEVGPLGSDDSKLSTAAEIPAVQVSPAEVDLVLVKIQILQDDGVKMSPTHETS